MLKKRGRMWWLDLWVGPKRVRRSLRTEERALAIERARDITLALRKPQPPGVVFDEFKVKYLEWAKQTKPASWRTEKYRVNIIGSWLNRAGLSTLDAITPHHLEQFRAWVMTKQIGHTTKVVGRSSANRYLALVRTMYNRARDWGVYEGPNPVSRVKFYRETGKAQPLSPADVRAILAAARTIAADPLSPAQAAVADLIEFLLNTGLRRSEALCLRWRDYTGTAISVVGKQDRRRTVPLNMAAQAIVERQPRDGAFVFPIPNRHQPDNLRRTVKHIRKLSGVSHFHLHLCRHYATTAMLGAGVDIQTAAEILGHTRMSTSLLYAHSSPERKTRAVEAIAAALPDTDAGHRPVDAHGEVADK